MRWINFFLYNINFQYDPIFASLFFVNCENENVKSMAELFYVFTLEIFLENFVCLVNAISI